MPRLQLPPVDIPRRAVVVLVCWGKAVVALGAPPLQRLPQAEGDQVAQMGLQVLQSTIPVVQAVRMVAVAVALALTHWQG